MKMFIPLLCLLSLSLAEPPVGDGYAAARSNHHGHHHESDHHQSHEHGAGFRNAPSQAYLPAARISQEYGVPSSHSLSQEYGVPDARSTPSQEYGAPSTRSGLSQQYDAHALDYSDSYPAARSLSPQYGVPELRSNPSEAYGGAAAQRNFNSAPFPTQKYGIPHGSTSRRSQFRSNTVSQGYAPAAKSASSFQSYSAPRNSFKSSAALRSPSQTYGAPKNAPAQTYGIPDSRSLSTSYGAPNLRNFESSVSQSYGPPSQKFQADTIEVVSARGLSQEYGISAHSDASSYASARNAAHGASGHDMPAEQYGVPQQYSVHEDQDQGYDYARNGLNAQLEEEEAGYDFAYKVEDYDSESDFGHQETREDNKVEGSYYVVLPDGTKQTVEYEADERGFKPRISLERADVSARAGYDDNAQDLSRSVGPY